MRPSVHDLSLEQFRFRRSKVINSRWNQKFTAWIVAQQLCRHGCLFCDGIAGTLMQDDFHGAMILRFARDVLKPRTALIKNTCVG